MHSIRLAARHVESPWRRCARSGAHSRMTWKSSTARRAAPRSRKPQERPRCCSAIRIRRGRTDPQAPFRPKIQAPIHGGAPGLAVLGYRNPHRANLQGQLFAKVGVMSGGAHPARGEQSRWTEKNCATSDTESGRSRTTASICARSSGFEFWLRRSNEGRARGRPERATRAANRRPASRRIFPSLSLPRVM
jgi:hypothetical protein